MNLFKKVLKFVGYSLVVVFALFVSFFATVNAVEYGPSIIRSQAQADGTFGSYQKSIDSSNIPLDLVFTMNSSTVKLYSYNDGASYNCTGVLLKNDEEGALVLTAKHCLNPSEENYVEHRLVTYMLASSHDDLALLFLDKMIPNKIPVRVGTVDPKVGDFVYHLGYPNDILVTFGKVLRETKDHTHAKLSIIPGCSGGGVFNEHGQLVGIVWGYIRSLDVAIYEPLRDVNIFLEETAATLKKMQNSVLAE